MDCVRHVLGSVPPNLKVLSVLADDDPQRKEDEARALIAQLDTGEGVLLLSDLFGATPCNIARRLYQPGRVEGVAGVNLPMLLRAVCYSNKPLAEVAQKALEGGRELYSSQLTRNREAAMLQQDALIINKLGLHARASAKLTQTRLAVSLRSVAVAQRPPRERQKHHGRDDAGRRQGQHHHIETNGEQEQEAMDALLALINDYFGEGE